VTMDSYLPGAQAWLDNGFAYLSINYRGSTSFGREFKESIWSRLGELEVRDIVAGRQWLVDHVIARPDEIFLTGWSYGGYLTLHALGTAPGLWAGGLAGMAVADWVALYDDSNDMLRAYQRAIFGGAPENAPEAHERSSPITYVEQVDAPVLIIQGRNDTRTPSRQVELYEERMRALGKPIEVVWFDAGHLDAGAADEQAIRFQELRLEFAQRVLAERRAAPGVAGPRGAHRRP
jgi:dipeptidyl aminopeptidase/acylaminoacyl peptidase